MPPAAAPSKPVRRTQAERSETMRARLAAAAYETIAAGGLKALRMRNVAEQAGVSQGALMHHFPDKNAVILAAVEQALILARDDVAHRVAPEASDPRALLVAMLDEFRAFFFSDRFWVAIGITMEAAKDPELYPAVRRAVAALRLPIYEAWRVRIEAAGWTPDAAALAVRGAAALVSGTAVRRFWAEDDAVNRALVEQWIGDRLAQRDHKSR